jgi:Protein of unknown function (DUF2975)
VEPTNDPSAQAPALQRIRRVSQPIRILIAIALALAIVVPIFQIVVVLFFADHLGSMRAFVSFSAWGLGLNVADPDQQLHLRSLAEIPVGTLSVQQRCAVAGLAALCAACTALCLSHLYRLFGLYSRGIVFAENNVRRIKWFGIWLVAAAISANVSGRLFVWVTGGITESAANAALTVIFGAMIYVIAHVMELGREADLERKGFL